jgi:peptidoglycan/LPS O-acetylase OafA/YrhL
LYRSERFRHTAYFGSLDGLRALSIVPVIWHHASPGPLDGVLGRGPLGVDLFFAISGFLITTMLLREREEHGHVSLGAFYARRSLRIFPLYYVVLAGFVIHAWLLRDTGPVRDHFFRSLPAYATYTSNWFVDNRVTHAVVFSFAWSLAAEEQFYLGFPWVLRVTKGVAPAAIFMAGVVLVDQAAERHWLSAAPLVMRMLESLATPIALGSLAALALRTDLFRALEAALGRRESPVVALALVVAGAVLAWPLLVVQLLMTALVVSCCLREDHLLAKMLGWRPLKHVGAVSYGMYLLNVPAIQIAKRAVPAPFVFVIGLALSVALATVARAAVEEPFTNLRARFRRDAPEPIQRGEGGGSSPAGDRAGGATSSGQPVVFGSPVRTPGSSGHASSPSSKPS